MSTLPHSAAAAAVQDRPKRVTGSKGVAARKAKKNAALVKHDVVRFAYMAGEVYSRRPCGVYYVRLKHLPAPWKEMCNWTEQEVTEFYSEKTNSHFRKEREARKIARELDLREGGSAHDDHWKATRMNYFETNPTIYKPIQGCRSWDEGEVMPLAYSTRVNVVGEVNFYDTA